MCGIFGELRASGDTAGLESFSAAATRALAHRGPDGHSTWHDERCLLGHTRLAILDLSSDGTQPMRSASGRTHVTFNGEIYNYLELKSGITPPPGGWRSTSDTEVLLESWDRSGPACLGGLLGMFAAAFWRPDQGELWLVRDRLGKKPLYYARTRAGALRFASEMGALLVDDAIPRSTTPDRMAEFLQHGFVAAPRSGLAEVSVLPPGWALRARVGPSGIDLRLERYWRLPVPGDTAHDFRDWSEEFAETLRDAVRIRLRSDVPIGTFLSGGVDSSVVSLLAAQETGGRLRTFTVDFEQADFSEGRFGAEVAQRLGSDHTELLVSARSSLPIDRLVATYGDLHGDASAIPTLALCRETRRHVTVALAGDGGDEILGGYGRYERALRDVAFARRLPKCALTAAHLVAARLPWWRRGAARLGRLSDDIDTFYASGFCSYAPRTWPPVLARRLATPWRDAVASSLSDNAARPDLLRLMASDLTCYLPEDILTKVDRASMSVGLEVRAPLLDHRLAELVMRADPGWLADGSGTKLPLRRLFADRLPATVFTRRKMGFGVPLKHWLRGDMARLARERLLSADTPLAPFLDRREVSALLRSHASSQRDESSRIWHLLVLDAWFDRWCPDVRTDPS